MLEEMKQKEVKMQQQLEQERTKLQQLQAAKDIAIAAARMKAYDDFEGFENHDEEFNDKISPACYRQETERRLNPDAALFQPHQAASEITMNQESVSLAQAIASSLSMNRLPVPEPTTFSGNPLQFTDWKMSFIALIDKKPLPPSEKIFYLKNYLAGEARKAVGGFFYRDSESACNGAWQVLQDRYGNPFIIQKAFRDKLMRWPKITQTIHLHYKSSLTFSKAAMRRFHTSKDWLSLTIVRKTTSYSKNYQNGLCASGVELLWRNLTHPEAIQILHASQSS